MKDISDQDYEDAQQVWNTMEKKALGCYHDTYLKADALLLADVFETFRSTCLKNYRLDPGHFYTTTGLVWQALSKTAAEYCGHKKSTKTVNYAPTGSGLSCLLICCWWLKKVFEVWLPRKLSVMLRLIISTWKTYKIPMKRAYIFSFWMQTTFTDGQWFRTYQRMDLNGRREKTLPLKKIDILVKNDRKGYLLEVDVEYPKELHENYNELPFLT